VTEGEVDHPNSRFTVTAGQCASISLQWEDARGVPISAIIWGTCRSKVVLLVMQAFDRQHVVFLGSGMGAETTPAATGAVGV